MENSHMLAETLKPVKETRRHSVCLTIFLIVFGMVLGAHLDNNKVKSTLGCIQDCCNHCTQLVFKKEDCCKVK